MKQSQTPMGEAFKLAIMIGKPQSPEDESEAEYPDEEDFNKDTEDESKGLPEGVTNPIIKLAPAEATYVEAMFEIVDEYGKLADNDGNGIWVGYESPAQNKNKSMGVKCSNCAFWCPKMKGCHIIAAKAEANGYCKLSAIGEGLVKGRK